LVLCNPQVRLAVWLGVLILTAWGGPKKKINGVIIRHILIGLLGLGLMGLGGHCHIGWQALYYDVYYSAVEWVKPGDLAV
jgi:hypothetical protein